MVFSSILFLFRFLPIMLVVYYCTPKEIPAMRFFFGAVWFSMHGRAGLYCLDSVLYTCSILRRTSSFLLSEKRKINEDRFVP